MIGKTLSHFRVLRKIGEGGMGVVYEAEDVELRRRVALKVLRREFLDKENRRQRFIREARTAAKVTHPNIATVYEVGEADGETLIAMEFVEGDNLRNRIGGRPLPIDEAMRLAVQIAEGLSAAHEAQIVHRDLKPENVMIGPEGRAQILDFGLAKPLVEAPDEGADADATVALSGEGRILGTVAYMAPEQARGLDVDARSDHFSFGITLYEMLTGKQAFHGETPSDTLTHILRDHPTPGIELNPQIPPELERILEKCLEKNPEDRYQDTRDLVVDLRRLVRDSESTSGSGEHRGTWSGSGSGIGRAPGRRVPLVAVGAAAVAVLAAITLVPRLIQSGSGAPAGTVENSVAVMPFQNLQDTEDAGRLGQILQELVISDLSGSTGLKVFSSQRLYDVQKQIGSDDRQFDRETASRIADRVGAQTMLEGTLSKLGEQWILTATVIDPATGTVEGSCRVDGSDLYQMVDELSQHLRKDPRLAVASRAQTSVREKTTGSLDAYRLYVVGADLLNREDYMAASDTLALAVEADPSFGRAYYKLGMAKWWTTQIDAYTNEEAQEPLRHMLDHGLYANRQERLMAEAAYELIGQNWDEAKELYEQVCELYPEEKEAWYGLGEAQFHSGKVPDAVTLASFEKAVDLDPSFTVAYQHIFDCNGRLGQPDASMARVRRFLTANPDRSVGYRWWVEVAHAAGREEEMKESLAEAKKHVTESSDWAKLLTMAARVSNERGDFVRGHRLLLEAKEASPEDVGFQWEALTAWSEGEMFGPDAVESRFAEIEKKWPEQVSMFWEGMLDLYIRKGETEKARAYLKEIRESEKYAKLAGQLVYVEHFLGDEESFQVELDRRLADADSDEKKADLLNDVGSKTLEITGDCEEARRWLERSLALDPENGWTHTSMGWCQLRTGELDAAAASFGVAAEKSPGHSMPRLGLAAVEMARGRPAEAERIYRELLDGRVEARALRWLSGALAEQKRWDEAEAAARQAVAMSPGPVGKTQLAWVLIAGERNVQEGVALATEARDAQLTAFRERYLELDFIASPEHCLGLAAVKLGEVQQGVALLEEAAELRPDRTRIREDLRQARALL